MSIHIANRGVIISAIRQELVGPSPQGEQLDCKNGIHFNDKDSFYRPYRQKDTGEEILQRDPPTKRYGVGVLYPVAALLYEEDPAALSGDVADVQKSENIELRDEFEHSAPESVLTEGDVSGVIPDDDDLDLSGANRLRPSTMGVSFLAELPPGSQVIIEATCGRYEPVNVSYETVERVWWMRQPIAARYIFDGDALIENSPSRGKAKEKLIKGNGPIDLDIELFTRTGQKDRTLLITVCMLNRSTESTSLNAHSLFQCHFSVTVHTPDNRSHVLPYPTAILHNPDEEEQSIGLLYKNFRTFAVGHGCAADWVINPSSSNAYSVSAECLPIYETASITPEIVRSDGLPLDISMVKLAGLDPSDDGFTEMEELITSYGEWIAGQEKQSLTLSREYKQAADRHISECRLCHKRMQEGLQYLRTNPLAFKAFQLANKAVLLQQLRNRREPRRIVYQKKERQITFSEPAIAVNLSNVPYGKGKWRPFQVAFLLASIISCAEPDNIHRRTVELIWFPTGGGKTEAYLGLAAFCGFLRRLRNKTDHGVSILMRYTLRLLTAQQFQRASALICAMEQLRRDNSDALGSEPFSIGIWLGADNTPNTRTEAISCLSKLRQRGLRAENSFVVTQCPWCGAEIGPIEGNLPNALKVIGYEHTGNTVILKCSDRKCDFFQQLPIYVIDEDIYDVRPTLIIGTVDKFAMLTWKDKARSIFGLGIDGNRFCSPPDLIIQDELHLISGPLGSMVGLYESVIEELCTDRRHVCIPPKIISSTATIRRYKNQIRSLYAREHTFLFPPPGISAEDSFFATYARNVNGENLPGRVYIGVHAPGLGSMQTVQVRVFSALLQAPMELLEEERDPWWTLLIFFNSLRELGTTLSLFQSDIPDYFTALKNRRNLEYTALRRIYRDLELTSRLRNDEVPRAIKELETVPTKNNNRAIDFCLASNIIEVGIDIDRLSLMSVVGQPKSTSQYIQVTGRIGRNWKERPGVVVTLYGAAKPRDRSHFEQFRSYHERLYAQVEPTSVTPLSAPALDRALHGVMVAYVRQLGDEQACRSPYPAPEKMLEVFRDILIRRAEIVDPDERDTIQRVFAKRFRQWKQWERTTWSGTSNSDNAPLMAMAGAYVPPDWSHVTWQTQTSMRNVDSECRVAITKLYLHDEDSDNE